MLSGSPQEIDEGTSAENHDGRAAASGSFLLGLVRPPDLPVLVERDLGLPPQSRKLVAHRCPEEVLDEPHPILLSGDRRVQSLVLSTELASLLVIADHAEVAFLVAQQSGVTEL